MMRLAVVGLAQPTCAAQRTNQLGAFVDQVHVTHGFAKRSARASDVPVLCSTQVVCGACRLVTPKYNPARTFTWEGTVGLGGAYLCVYPMNSPGGYQLMGRTLPIWSTHGASGTVCA